jgi:hypothetical protein
LERALIDLELSRARYAPLVGDLPDRLDASAVVRSEMATATSAARGDHAPKIVEGLEYPPSNRW